MTKDNSSKPTIIKAASACVWRGDEVLLAQRGKSWGYGLWSLPGGSIEHGETEQQAALRELFEETQVVADLRQRVGAFQIKAPHATYVITCFTGHYLSGKAVAATDAMAVAWVNCRELDDFHLTPNNMEAIALARNLISV